MKVYLVYGEAFVSYEPGSNWHVRVFTNKADAYALKDQLQALADAAKPYYRGDPWKELQKLDPKLQGGDEVQYDVDELELV